MLEFDRTMAPSDHMLTGDLEGYFRTAQSGLNCVLSGVKAAGRDPATIMNILDFGSGYGRVYRALAAAFPGAKLMASDLMADAARFCAETFGGDWIQSHEDLSELQLDRKFDVIWLGSVYTHLPAHRWVTLTQFLRDALTPDGVTVFTTHGARAIVHFENVVMKRNQHLISVQRYASMKGALPLIGFDFVPSRAGNLKHQRTLGMEISEDEYGFSFTEKWWVAEFLDRMPGVEMVDYTDAGWSNNHDAVTFKRLESR